MTQHVWPLLFGARTHACRTAVGGDGPAGGWFGGPPLTGWSVPRGVDGASSMIVVAVLALGTLLADHAEDLIVLYVDPRSVGACAARRERGTWHHGSARDSHGGAAAFFALTAPVLDTSWVPGVSARGALGSKVGGRPGYLQQDLADEPQLQARGYEFLAQVDCEGGELPASLGSLLCDGGLYVFAKRRGDAFDLDRLEVRWQY